MAHRPDAPGHPRMRHELCVATRSETRLARLVTADSPHIVTDVDWAARWPRCSPLRCASYRLRI